MPSQHRTRYEQVTSEPGKFSEIFLAQHVRGIHKMACCDCALVHDMKFTSWVKTRKNGKVIGYKKLPSREVVVMVQARRNERATAGRRRKKQKCVKA